MTQKKINTTPNQRIIKISKSPTDKDHKYALINLEAMAEAGANLNTLGGFKLYIYLVKNQNSYEFALSSSDFREWSGLGYRAYSTAFDELLKKGYLVPISFSSSIFFFRDSLDIAPPQINTFKNTHFAAGFVF